MLVLALPFDVTVNKIWWYYRILLNVTIIIIISLIVSIFPSFNDRRILLFEYDFGIFIFIIVIACAVVSPFMYVIFCEYLEIVPRFVFNSKSSEDRSLLSMIEFHAWNDITECIEYGFIDTESNQVYFDLSVFFTNCLLGNGCFTLFVFFESKCKQTKTGQSGLLCWHGYKLLRRQPLSILLGKFGAVPVRAWCVSRGQGQGQGQVHRCQCRWQRKPPGSRVD